MKMRTNIMAISRDWREPAYDRAELRRLTEHAMLNGNVVDEPECPSVDAYVMVSAPAAFFEWLEGYDSDAWELLCDLEPADDDLGKVREVVAESRPQIREITDFAFMWMEADGLVMRLAYDGGAVDVPLEEWYGVIDRVMNVE